MAKMQTCFPIVRECALTFKKKVCNIFVPPEGWPQADGLLKPYQGYSSLNTQYTALVEEEHVDNCLKNYLPCYSTGIVKFQVSLPSAYHINI